MPRITFIKPFTFYENGCWPVQYEKGQADVSDECALFAEQCGVVAKPFKQKAKK